MEEKEFQDFEEQYLLLHTVLYFLVQTGFSESHVFRQDSGKRPIHNFNIASAHATLGTLTNYINHGMDKYNPNDGNVFWRNKLDLPVEESENDKYTSVEIAGAVELLRMEDEVKSEIVYHEKFPQNKEVTLTEKGFQSFLTNKYIIKRWEVKRTKQLHDSQINTNAWMIFLTVIIAISTAIPLFKGCEKEPIKEETSKSKSQPISDSASRIPTANR